MKGPCLVICLAGFFLGDAVARDGDSIRCSFEWIEVSLEDLDVLLAKKESTLPGGPIRDELDQWIAEGRAAVVRTAMVAARSGHRAKVESGDTIHFAEAFTAPQADGDGTLRARPVPDSTKARLVGVSVELDPVLDLKRARVEVSLAAEIVTQTGHRRFGNDIAEVEVPEFHSMKTVTRLSLRNREPRLVGTFAPPDSLRPEGRASADPRLILFVTAEFASDEPPESVPAEDFAMHCEFLETDLATLNAWIVDEGLSTAGPALRERFAEAVRRGEARLLDSVVAAGLPGRLQLDSVRQVMFPTQYDPPEAARRVPAMPTAFEKWNVGLMLDFAAEWLPNGLLRINPRESDRRGRVEAKHAIRLSREIGEQRWMKDEAEASFPLFFVMEIQQRIDLSPGDPVLLGTLRPERSEPDGSEASLIAVFARAERIGTTSSEE